MAHTKCVLILLGMRNIRLKDKVVLHSSDQQVRIDGHREIPCNKCSRSCVWSHFAVECGKKYFVNEKGNIKKENQYVLNLAIFTSFWVTK